MASPKEVVLKGAIIEVTSVEAADLIARGFAELVDDQVINSQEQIEKEPEDFETATKKRGRAKKE